MKEFKKVSKIKFKYIKNMEMTKEEKDMIEDFKKLVIEEPTFIMSRVFNTEKLFSIQVPNCVHVWNERLITIDDEDAVAPFISFLKDMQILKDDKCVFKDRSYHCIDLDEEYVVESQYGNTIVFYKKCRCFTIKENK